jgi:hypothetical protein
MLAYGVAGDLIDEYFRMSESTFLESIYKFCKAVIAVFGTAYLREPTVEDTSRLLSINEEIGFPGMIGSIECIRWEWKNCPLAWQDHYSGHPMVALSFLRPWHHKIFGCGTLFFWHGRLPQ